jgi:hypothetical protein
MFSARSNNMKNQTVWKTELWDADGKKAKWHHELQDIEAVAAIIKKRGTNEIVRVLAPKKATPSDLERLRDLGAQPL